MQIIDVWDYQVWDGGNRHYHAGYFSRVNVSSDEAIQLAGQYDMIDAKEIVVYSSIQEYKDELNETVKKRALAKLSSEERRVLGF